MKKFSKKFSKKLISIMTLATMILASMISPASAKIVTSTRSNSIIDPNFPNLENVVLYQDYESGFESSGPIALNGATATTIDSQNEDFGFVKQIEAKNASLSGKDITQTSIPVGDSVGFTTEQDKGRVIFDVDVMLKDKTQNYIIMLRDSKGVDYGWIMFDCKGNILFDKDGYAPSMKSGKNYEKDSVIGGTYTPGSRNHISAIITPNGIDTIIDFYIDGKYITTATEDFWRNHTGDEKDKITGELARFFIFTAPTYTNGEDAEPEKSETAAINIDNVCVSYADQYDNFYSNEPIAANGKIKVGFNETLASDNTYDQIKVIGIDGVEKAKQSVSVYDRELTITMQDSLVGGESYAVVVPNDFLSITGHKLADTAVTFVAPNDFNILFEQNFDALSIGANSTPAGFYADTKMFGNDFNIVNNPDSSKVGNVVFIDGTTTGPYFRWFGMNDPNTPDQRIGVHQYYGASNYITASTDFYFDELSHTANMYILGPGDKRFADAYFDGKGNFIVKKVIDAPTSYQNAYAYDLSKYTVYSGIKPKKWYTVKTVTNCVDKTVSWYLIVDGQEYFVAQNLYFQDGEGFREIRLQASTVNSVNNNAGKFYLDNVKIENSNSADIKKVLTAQADESAKEVDFTAQSADVPDEYVLSFDISTDILRPTAEGTANDDKTSPTYYVTSEARYDYKNTPNDKTDDAIPSIYFQMNRNGELVMEKGLNSFWSDTTKVICPAVESAKDGNFSIKFYINKSATKTVSIYVDEVLVRRMGLGWGNDNNSYQATGFPYDGKAVSANYHKFTKIGISEASESTNISNAKIGLTSVNSPIDIALTDTFNKTYKVQSNQIPGNVKTIAVKYKNALNDGVTFDNCKLANTDGSEVLGLHKTLNGDTITITVPDRTYLENGKTYMLTLNGIDGAKDFSTQFTINDTGISSVTGLKMYKGNAELGDDTIVSNDVISAGCVVDNPTSVEKKCILLLVEYDAEQKLMHNIKYQYITASPYSSVTIDTTNNIDTAIVASGSDSVFKAFVFSSFERLYPLTHFVQK